MVNLQKGVRISLIISIYRNVDFLELVLKSVGLQMFKDFEVIIAEDGNSKEMKQFIVDQSKIYDFKIKHIFQKDEGFRKNRILNQALKIARGEFLVFIDGDCILHKKFLKEYSRRADKSTCLFGRRVELDRETTNKLLKTKDLKLLSTYRLLFTKTKKIEDAIYLPFSVTNRMSGIVGSNFCVPREKMYEINGFDNDFESPTFGEDTDIERRLRLIGINLRCTKNKTIQYHLYHKKRERKEDSKHNKKLYQRKLEEGKWYCENGLIDKRVNEKL